MGTEGNRWVERCPCPGGSHLSIAMSRCVLGQGGDGDINKSIMNVKPGCTVISVYLPQAVKKLN